MGRGKQQCGCGHLSCSTWGAQGQGTEVSSFVCALSSEGETTKPPPRQRGAQGPVGARSACQPGAEVRCWGHHWHQALPRSQELIMSPQVTPLGSSPRHEESVPCPAVPCCALLCHTALPSSVPLLLTVSSGCILHRHSNWKSHWNCSGAQARAGGRSTRQVWAHPCVAPNAEPVQC